MQRLSESCWPEIPVSDLALVVAAVRGGTATTARAGRSRHRSEVVFFASILIFLHTAFSGAYPVPSADPGPHEELQMNGMSFAARSAVRFSAALAPVAALSAPGIVSAQDAVEWRVADGGNGHWYEVRVTQTTIAWTDARAQAVVLGADLAKAGSTTSLQWLFQLSLARAGAWKPFGNSWLGPWLGGRQQVGASEPNGGWEWVDGSSIDLAATRCGFNNSGGCGVNEDRLSFWKSTSAPLSANTTDYETSDFPDRGYCEPQFPRMTSYIVEWSADCNQDGLVDYGQIRAGALVDANANNIPDCCEQAVSCTPCQADVDESGAVNSVDLAAVLANWGTDGGKYPRADVNGDGTINSSDLAAVLSEWGPCQ